jgi:hypothetical protein
MRFLFPFVAAWGTNDDGSPCYFGNCWTDHSELVHWVSPSEEGSPVYSSDGTLTAAIEQTYERQISFPPLQGWFNKRKFRYRIVVQDPATKKKTYMNPMSIGQPSLDYLFYMKQGTLEYALINVFQEYVGTVLKISNQGMQVVGNSTDSDFRFLTYVPSRDASQIARISCDPYLVTRVNNTAQYEFAPSSPCQVEFMDAATLETTNRINITLASNPAVTGTTPLHYWSLKGSLVLSDQNTTTVAIDPTTSKVENIPLQECKAPRTSSSQVNPKTLELLTISRNNIVSSNKKSQRCTEF